MQTVKRFGLLSDQAELIARFQNSEVLILSHLIPKISNFQIDILAIDLAKKDLAENLMSPEFKNTYTSIQKIIFIHDYTQSIPTDLLILRTPDLVISVENLNLNSYLIMDEKLSQSQQDLVYLNLASELNTEYEQLKNELEKKLSDHQKNMIESRQKILDSNNRNEALRKILYALHQESDIARIETLLNELLPAASNATWIKLIQKNIQTDFEVDLKSQLGLFFQSYDLNNSVIYFIKGDKKIFKKTDLELFQKIRDALLLNLTRNQNLSDLILAEKILTEAFETFPYPLAIIDSEYNVLNSNKTFFKYNKEKCYQILFDLSTPCKGCKFGQKFQTEQNQKTFEVTSNAFSSESLKKNIWVHTYKDRTEELYLEQRLTQNAKMKDLGLISSSIAHELNNPLGGIISYLQILQMEISAESDLQPDLQAMIQTSFKMKKIIEDLLVFSRRPQSLVATTERLATVILESLSENELAFKSENIKIIHSVEANDWMILLSKSTFKDSVYFIYQFFIERARNIKKVKQNFTGLVEIKFFDDAIKRTLRFVGNFGPLENDYKLKNVQFLAIHKTLIDQGFHVELTEPDKTWVAIDLILPR